MKDIPIRKISKVQKEPGFSENFDIRNVADLLAGKDMVQELHRHEFFLILALQKGMGNHEIDFIPYRIRDHSIFIMRPGQVHRLTLKAKSTGYLLQFKDDFYNRQDNPSNQGLRQTGSKNLYQFTSTGFKKIVPILISICKEYTGKQRGYQEVIKANLAILFIELVRQNEKSFSINIDPYIQKRLDEFLGLLGVHVGKLKQVTEYADIMNLSTFQLNSITKTLVGKTGSVLINEQIILESKRYLLATTNQVNQIAYSLGYEDVSYFIRFFKKHTGFTPDAFRHNFR